MIAPVVHLNGTSQQELLEQVETAMVAVTEAQQALAKMRPHMRDYYVHPQEGAFHFAEADALIRERALDRVHTELSDLYVAIDSQKR